MNAPASLLFPATAPAGAPPARTLRDLLAAAWRQLPLIVGCTVVLTLIALWLYYQQPRVYTSSAKVWVQTEQQGSPSFLSGIAAYRETPYPDPVNRKIETEIELMLTRSNAQAVVQRLDIQDEQLARGAFGKLRAQLSALFSSHADADDAAAPARFKTVDAFLDGITIEPLRSKTADTTSNVLEVRFECADAALAPRALQAFLDNYLQLGAQQNRRLGETTFRLLQTKADEARDDLRRSEDEIVALRMKDSQRASADLSGEALAAYAAAPGPGPAAAMQALGTPRLRLDTDPDVAPAGSGRMRSPREAAAALGAPVLGALPTLSPWARQALTGSGFAGAPTEPRAATP